MSAVAPQSQWHYGVIDIGERLGVMMMKAKRWFGMMALWLEWMDCTNWIAVVVESTNNIIIIDGCKRVVSAAIMKGGGCEFCV
jgi:hypothetical protein